MPSASRHTSRRRRQETPADDIEDAPGALTQENDEDVDEQPEPTRRRATRPQEELRRIAEEDTPEDDGRIDIESFQDQPLDNRDAQKLYGISSDWALIRKKFHSTAFSLVRDTAVGAEESAEGEEAREACRFL
jgi:E3 SUMO-protein ligase NSE2